MTKDDQTPATKADIRTIHDEMNVVKADIRTIHDEMNVVKTDIRAIRNDITVFKGEILRHFDLAVEAIRHDLQGANRDEIETVKDRVTRLERHTGLVPA